MHPAFALVSASLLAGSALAQTVSFLEPTDPRPALGEEIVLIQQRRDRDGNTTPFPWVVPHRLYHKSAFTQRNLHDPAADAPDAGEGAGGLRFTPDHPGEWMIGADLPEHIEPLPTAELRAFLAEHVPAASGIELPRATVRVRRVESMTTSFLAPGEAVNVSIWKNGQRVEIRPLLDPLTAEAPSTILARVYVDGTDRPGARLRATHVPTGRSSFAMSDAKGIAQVVIDAPGAWRLEFHHAVVPPEGATTHDVTLYTSTLTFVNGAQP